LLTRSIPVKHFGRLWAIIVAMETPDLPRSKRAVRFAEEYAKDRNGTKAAIRAGYAEASAGSEAARLLQDPRVLRLVEDQTRLVTQAAAVDAAAVLREWFALATGDPTEVARIRRVNCRYCNGVDHAYQWTAREYAEACDKAAARELPLPDCAGGFGWALNGPPSPDCPECQGEGTPDLFLADMERLTPLQKKLIAGVERSREGVKVKFRDPDAALRNIAQYLGMLVERKELTGKDGQPLNAPAMPAQLPTDAKVLGALYLQVMG